MPKKLLTGLFWILLANLIVKPLWLLGIEVGVQNAVGNSMYGLYSAVFNLAYILNILLDLGLTNFNTRNIARHPHLIGKHMGGILGIKLCLLALYVVAAFTIGALLGYGSDEFSLLAWLCLAQFLNSLILYLRSNFEALLLFRWDSLFSILDRLLMIAICGMLLRGPYADRFTILWFAKAQVAAYAITAVSALVVIGRRVHLRKLRWNRVFFIAILRKSAPYALLVLLMASYNRLDPILLRLISGSDEAGIYAGAFRLLDALTMVTYLVSVPLLPIFSRQTACADHEGLVQSVRLVFAPTMAFAIGASITLSAMASPLMEAMYNTSSERYAAVFRLLVFGIIPIGVTYIFGTLLTAGGRLRELNIFAASSLLLNAALNLALIPRLGATGSAWASLSAQGMMAAAQAWLAMRVYALPTASLRLWRLALFTLLMLAVNTAAARLALAWQLWMAAAVFIALVSVPLLRLADPREVAKMLRQSAGTLAQ
ncbi:MAG: polysaccharide biosynthesis protein [Bacteroidales bacterium]|nr:polysaccharide biosynthesis protein [Bacteroidales bacterium]